MRIEIDWRTWGVSVLTAFLVYIAVSLALEGQLNLARLGVFVVAFGLGWLFFTVVKEKLLQ